MLHAFEVEIDCGGRINANFVSYLLGCAAVLGGLGAIFEREPRAHPFAGRNPFYFRATMSVAGEGGNGDLSFRLKPAPFSMRSSSANV